MVPEQLSYSETAKAPDLSFKLKVVFSLLIIGHLMAVFLPPLAFQASGPFGGSPSVSSLLRPVEGYGQFLYLDRGYAFFAPDPGPSHLIQAAVTDADGERVESMYPDLEHQWPRLNYHRHFMLAEFLNDLYQPSGPPPELIEADRAAADEWARLRERYERVRQSIRDHLSHVNDGKDVAIRRIEHLIPNFVEYVEDPIALDDERLYVVLLDQSLDAPVGPPEAIPPPTETESPSAEDTTSDGLEAPVTPADATDATSESEESVANEDSQASVDKQQDDKSENDTPKDQPSESNEEDIKVDDQDDASSSEDSQ